VSVRDTMEWVRLTLAGERQPNCETSAIGPMLWPEQGALPTPSTEGLGYSFEYQAFWVWTIAGRHFGICWKFRPGWSERRILDEARQARERLMLYVQGLLPAPPADLTTVPSNPGVFNPDGGMLPR
jgi:hypothetical protein